MKPVKYADLTFPERREIREKYIADQDGKCCHCGGDLASDPPSKITDLRINWRAFPANFLRYPVHLHHSHDTGLTIGAVHAYCNAVLWQYHGE